MKRVKPTKHREARWLSTHTHSTVQIEKHVQQSTVSEINFSFALFEHLLVTICSLKTHSLQAFVHSALNTASILTKTGRSSFHTNYWTSNMACYIADCGLVVDMGFTRGLLRRLCPSFLLKESYHTCYYYYCLKFSHEVHLIYFALTSQKVVFNNCFYMQINCLMLKISNKM